MKYSAIVAPLLALMLAAPPAIAAQPGKQSEASIPFANHFGVRDWVSQGDQTIYFQAYSGRQWYKATLWRPSPDLPFATAIGFDTGPIDRLDKWSTVVIEGQRYPLLSFVAVDGPPAKPAKGK